MSAPKNYVGELAAQLSSYRTKGQKQAALHRPPTDALRMDQQEATLHMEAEKWLSNEQHIFDALITNVGRALVEIRQKLIEWQNKVDQLSAEAPVAQAISVELAGDRPILVSAAEQRLRAQVECRAFQAENHITEQADYPESHLWHFGIIAVLALIETVINAFFYENAQGLLGGFTVALGVAVVNMVGALVLGMGFRFKNLIALDKKLFGWLCLLLFLVLSIYCNALFSAFRAEYQLLADPSSALQIREAFATSVAEAKRIFVLDMHIADLMSFVLFGLGLILSGVAFWKGYTFDDKYPGHGRKDRAVKKAERLEREKQEILRQKIRDSLHRKRSELQTLINEPTQFISRISSRASEVEHAQSLLSNQAQAIQRDYALVMSAYRQANTAIRATDPPEYFKDIEDLTARVSLAAGASLLQELRSTRDEAQELRDKKQPLLNDKLSNTQNDIAEVMNNDYPEFLRDVESEAQDKINRMMPTIHRDE